MENISGDEVPLPEELNDQSPKVRLILALVIIIVKLLAYL